MLAETTPPPVLGDDTSGVSAAIVDGLFERLQTASLIDKVITLVVFAVVVVTLSIMLYRSIPPGTLKDRIGREIYSGSDRTLAGLEQVAKLTPTDIDDDLVKRLREKLHAQLQIDIAHAVDAKFNTSAG